MKEIKLPELRKRDCFNITKIGQTFSYCFEDETHCQSPLGIAQFAAQFVSNGQSCLVFVEAINIWPSSQDHFLVTSFCDKAIGGEALKDGMWLSVDSFEQGALATLVHLSMILGWDVSFYNVNSLVSVAVDHDSNISFFAEHALLLSKQFEKTTGRLLKSSR